MRKTILALLIASTLSACALTPPVADTQTELPSAWRSDFVSDVSIGRNWWAQFDDPVLDQLISAAEAHNQNLVIAAARIDEARAALGISSAEQLPRLDLGGKAGRGQSTQIGSPSDSYSLGATASWELDLWGRIKNTNDAAKADLLASEYNRDAVALALYANVAQSYFNLRALDQQLAIAQDTLKTRQESFQLRKRRFEGGVTSELDMRQAEVELAAAQASVPGIEQSIAKVSSSLSILIGQNPREMIESGIARGKELKQIILPVNVPLGLPSELLVRRPDIQASEQSLKAAGARIAAARAAYYPTISLTGLLGTESASIGDLFSGPAKTWSFLGNLAAPLFDNGRTAANVDGATARQKQAVANYRLSIQQAFAETQSALIARSSSAKVVAAQQLQLDSLSRQLKLATLRYDNGFSGYLEVLDAQRSLFQAQLNLAAAQRDQLNATVDLYKAMGGGWKAGT
ncbi:efflux transporter outer membrane subunit [Iodobacter fluviatilis]|uniref:Multidrug efflux system outer membrane protein n=1 Tax=Iodobacter fluviatilis TaxID=537 RepID=A0A377Q8J1_9NEIS|nr:efflux transporter outer membrane subunit [Iodobacter fluviatilis]TCU88877.1 multidrug efflux system outer membrane protein [Iodobacter fluviatilis]STQ91050.1 Outer membrane protein oprM precursor [Iodobacter fluviatilis]